MLDTFFALGNADGGFVPYTYNYGLVLISYLVASAGSVLVLFIASEQASISNQRIRFFVKLIGAAAFGMAVWSMHFIGMLAFSLCTTVEYDVLITFLSIIPAMIAGYFALHSISSKTLSASNLLLGGLITGSGIGLMHYSGMLAMRMNVYLRFDPFEFALSIVAAVALALAALYCRAYLARKTKLGNLQLNLVGGAVMGLAISAMHYMGMSAARFIGTPEFDTPVPAEDQFFLVLMVLLVVVSVLGFVFSGVLYERIQSLYSQVDGDLKLSLATANIGIFHHDLATDRVTLGGSFRSIWDLPKAEYPGAVTLSDLLARVAPESVDEIKDFVERANSSSEIHGRIWPLIRPDGTRRYVEVHRKAYFDDGSRGAVRGTVIDITNEVSAREKIEQQVRDLEALSRKRSQLLGMVAHELRTPVATIMMIANEPDEEEWRRNRNSILSASRDLINTIDDMRLLINPDLKRPVRSEGFTVQSLNASVASGVASIVASTGVQYRQYNAIPIPFTNSEFSIDTYRVRIAITNLVKNACLHSQGEQVWMISRLLMGRDNKQYLQWVVGDDGIGIPVAQVARLFEYGQRGDSQAEGSGLGLHITRSWIEEIGGSVEYRRRESGGSLFIVNVPLVKSTDAGAESQIDAGSQGDLQGLLSSLNILMVEDEPMLRMLGEKLLKRLVNDVTTAENGLKGLNSFDPGYHNLVLTDYFMPEMSGVEMTRKLREQGYKGIILGVTAATIGEQREELVEAGVDLVMPKPLNAQTFKTAILQLIQDGNLDPKILRNEASE